MDNKWAKTNYDIITDKNVEDKEIKLYCIIDLLAEEYISRRKAYELCYEIGVFTSEPIGVDMKTTEIWEKYWLKD